MINYFYKITNKINNKFYFGVHKTNNLNDGYFGSGKRLFYAISKYGRDNFEKEILECFDTYKEALDFEAEIVDEILVLNDNCYNLRKGGNGGFTKEESSRGAQTMLSKVWQDDKFIERNKERMKNLVIRLRKEGKIKPPDWTGLRHSDETKRKIGETNSKIQKGSGNSQYNTCWITNGVKNKKIKKNTLIPDGWKLGRIIKAL